MKYPEKLKCPDCGETAHFYAILHEGYPLYRCNKCDKDVKGKEKVIT